jgi:hypothetical protein
MLLRTYLRPRVQRTCRCIIYIVGTHGKLHAQPIEKLSQSFTFARSPHPHRSVLSPGVKLASCIFVVLKTWLEHSTLIVAQSLREEEEGYGH